MALVHLLANVNMPLGWNGPVDCSSSADEEWTGCTTCATWCTTEGLLTGTDCTTWSTAEDMTTGISVVICCTSWPNKEKRQAGDGPLGSSGAVWWPQLLPAGPTSQTRKEERGVQFQEKQAQWRVKMVQKEGWFSNRAGTSDDDVGVLGIVWILFWFDYIWVFALRVPSSSEVPVVLLN